MSQVIRGGGRGMPSARTPHLPAFCTDEELEKRYGQIDWSDYNGTETAGKSGGKRVYKSRNRGNGSAS